MKMPAATPNKDNSFVMLRRLIAAYLRPRLKDVAKAMTLMALSGAMTAAIAKLIQPVLDDVIVHGRANMIVPVALAVLGAFAVRGASTYGHTVMMTKVGQSIIADIQSDLFSRFMTLDLAFYHFNPSGQLVSRVLNDVNVMRLAISETLTGIGKSLLTLIFLVGLMLYQDWKLSVFTFAVFPFAGFIVASLGRRLRKVSANIQSELAGLSDLLTQIFQGIRQVKAYGMEEYEKKRAGEAIARVRKLNVKSVSVGNISTPFNEVLVGLVTAGIITYGGYQVNAHNMTAGQLGSFIAAFALAYEPMKKLARFNNMMQMGLGATQRVFEMLDEQPRIHQKPDAVAFTARRPEIIFQDVSFRYEGAEDKALNNVSFTARPGMVTALVGPSGGGKSTIINLIPRFYDAISGSLKIDGVDVRDFDIASLRKNIALVSQDITIFDDTIAANIAYGTPEAGIENVILAARAAAADEFIRAFPDGYDARVGENGLKLSGGQRQRIAIARAILRDAPILLLDEATSALDNESEKAIQAALAELEKGRTTIVIAHRLTTVQTADKIIVLDKGRIAEQGNHAELLARGGLYARMHEAGLRD